VTFLKTVKAYRQGARTRSQLGIGSRVYAPGPYSPRESMPAAWDREYLRVMG